ncbi:DUF5627 domain-containing protein [Labilibacter marinus]|uniref:DUF5627 domain-containing protein n=1 Tax=Labilibacter marinus TaxID=1477105 RepID=UPI000834A053|nr:DUF5627 domain-containing protein [Labilibacter marinus]
MKTKLLILFAVALGFIACENQDKEYDDFGSTAVYFPFQRPARSLILGKYDLGFNDNDNNHRFEIGVTMTGVYANKAARKVHFAVAPELLNGVANVQALPSSYYTIEIESPVTIPAGSIKGRIPVQLTEDFFNDPLAFHGTKDSVNYVVPLLITEIENLDTLLQGLPLVENPLRVKADDWEIEPKDYTLYGIKFINKFHGKYLRRGADEATDATGEKVTTVYHAEYVERDEIVKLTTTGNDKVELSNIVRRDGGSPGNVNMELSFNAEGNCIITSFDEDAYNVSGSGKYVEDGDEWGGEKRDVIYLDYTYTDAVNNETHAVKDTLVIRNRDVVFEEFDIVLSE